MIVTPAKQLREMELACYLPSKRCIPPKKSLKITIVSLQSRFANVKMIAFPVLHSWAGWVSACVSDEPFQLEKDICIEDWGNCQTTK